MCIFEVSQQVLGPYSLINMRQLQILFNWAITCHQILPEPNAGHVTHFFYKITTLTNNPMSSFGLIEWNN